jgi:hypothetical protein
MNSGNQTLLLELSIESDIESKLEQRVTGEKSPAFGMWSYTDLYRDRTILNKWTTPYQGAMMSFLLQRKEHLGLMVNHKGLFYVEVPIPTFKYIYIFTALDQLLPPTVYMFIVA